MRQLSPLALAAILTGAPTFREFPPETKAEEITWQSLHAVDIADTLAIHRDPDCYYETVVAPLIGKHPSEAAVMIWGAGWSGVHFLVTDWLNDHTPSLVRYWQGLTIASTGFWVVHNRNNGIRPLSHNEPPAGSAGNRMSYRRRRRTIGHRRGSLSRWAGNGVRCDGQGSVRVARFVSAGDPPDEPDVAGE